MIHEVNGVKITETAPCRQGKNHVNYFAASGDGNMRRANSGQTKLISLHPLTSDEAVADLLKVKPSPKGKGTTKKKPKKKEGQSL